MKKGSEGRRCASGVACSVRDGDQALRRQEFEGDALSGPLILSAGRDPSSDDAHVRRFSATVIGHPFDASNSTRRP